MAFAISLLLRLRYSARLMHCAMRMLHRRIYGIKLNRHFARINQVMPCACRNNEDAVLFNTGLKIEVVFRTAHFYNSAALLDADELVCIWVNFKPNIFTCIYAHKRELQMPAGPQGSSITIVIDSCFFYINCKRLRTIINGIRVALVLPISLAWAFMRWICAIQGNHSSCGFNS